MMKTAMAVALTVVFMFGTAASAQPFPLDSIMEDELECSQVTTGAGWLPPLADGSLIWVYLQISQDIQVGEKYLVRCNVMPGDQVTAPEKELRSCGDVIWNNHGCRCIQVALHVDEEPVDLADVTDIDPYRLGVRVNRTTGSMMLKRSVIVRDNIKVVAQQCTNYGAWVDDPYSNFQYGDVVAAGTYVRLEATGKPGLRAEVGFAELPQHGQFNEGGAVWHFFYATQSVFLADDVVCMVDYSNKTGADYRHEKTLSLGRKSFVAEAKTLQNANQWAVTSADLNVIHFDDGSFSTFFVQKNEQGEESISMLIWASCFRLSPNMRLEALENKSAYEDEDGWIKTVDGQAIGRVAIILSSDTEKAPNGVEPSSPQPKAEEEKEIQRSGGSGGGCNVANNAAVMLMALPLLFWRHDF